MLLAGVAAAQDPTCAACGNPITDQTWITVDGKAYHKTCARCAHCGKMVTASDDIIVHDGKMYHRHCYVDNVLPRCCVCNRPMDGTYFVDAWGNGFCSRHKDKVPRCDYCGRIISETTTSGGVTYGDGRHVCNICRRTAIEDKDDVKRSLREVRGMLAAYNIDIDLDRIEVELIDRNKMIRELDQGEETPGVTRTEYVHRDGDRGEMNHDIYMLHGMPRTYFNQVLAHELMHVWINRHHTHDQILGHDGSKAFIEGSCNYAAYLVLRSYGTPEANHYIGRMLSNEDVHYGLGFREVKNFVDRFNINYWLSYLEDHNQLPGR
jgi:hypothetical protein